MALEIRETVRNGHLGSALSGKFTIPSPEGIYILLYCNYHIPTYLKTMKWWSHEAPNFKCECMITLLSFWLAKPSQISSVVKGNLHLHQMNYDKDFYHQKAKEITTPFLLILSKTWWTHAPPKGYELADFVKLFGRESSSECFFHLYTIYNFHSEKLFPPN